MIIGRVVLALALMAPAAAWAQAEQQRINQGAASGRLTPGEYNNLQTRQDTIQRDAERDRLVHGGHLTRHEAVTIHRRQRRLSHSTYIDKHNRATYPGAR